MHRGITFVAGARPDDASVESFSVVPHRAVLNTDHIDTTSAGALHRLGIAGLPSFLLKNALLEKRWSACCRPGGCSSPRSGWQCPAANTCRRAPTCY
jgi:hypothetical protein